MARIPRARSLQALHSGLTSATMSSRTHFVPAARCISSTRATQSKNTEWVRNKLWKGQAPGPADPYTQRAEPEQTNLPDEAFQEAASRPAAPSQPQRKRSIVLPPKYSEAMNEMGVKEEDVMYTPATTMEGLEEVPQPQKWWDEPGHWGKANQYQGFALAPEKKILDKDVVSVILRRSLIETLVLKEAGKLPELVKRRWPLGKRRDLDAVLAMQIEVKDGQATLKGDAAPIVEALESYVSKEEMKKGPPELKAAEATEMIKAWNDGWKEVVLTDDVKFALRKRLYQHSGNLIPDAKVGAARTVQHLITLGSIKPRPKKLTEMLVNKTELPTLSNVAVHTKKVKFIEKETQVGRWKVIKDELQKRGMPVRGNDKLPRNVEGEWIKYGGYM